MKKKDLFFLAYLSRLGFYGVPVFLSFYFAAYFNSLLVIMCLFSFHLLYIILELKKNLKRYKARKTSG